jgi:hypothetical protein
VVGMIFFNQTNNTMEGRFKLESHLSYKDYLIQTVEQIYPKYKQEKLIKLLEKEGLIKFSDTLLNEDAVDLTGVDENEYFKNSINKSKNVIKKIEETEFTDSYNYSAIFSIKEYPEIMIEQLSKRNAIRDFNNEDFDHDILFDDEYSHIFPTKYAVDDVIILKFSRLLTGYLPVSGNNQRTAKYPILAIFFKDLNIFEVRFGKVKGYLKNNDEYFYRKQIDLIIEWLEENLQCEIDPLNMSPVIDYISKLEQDDVNVSAQAMNLRGGGKAVLDTGVNDDYVLPLLGELKGLIKANQELFDKNKEIKELIENFILETEDTADLPWISLTWRNESKSNATKVKFNFNYMNQEYSLLQYYYGNKTEMERMNNVTRYLIENKKALDKQCGD